MPLTGMQKKPFASTVVPHERQRRKREVDSSYATTTPVFCDRAVNDIKSKQGIAWADS